MVRACDIPYWPFSTKNSLNKFCSYFEKIGTDYIKVDLKNISFDLDTEDDLNLLTLDKLNKLIS